jgi:hypothetical protein
MSKLNWHNHKPYQKELYKLALKRGVSKDAAEYLGITIAGLPSGTIVPSGVGYSSLMQRDLVGAGLIEIREIHVGPRIFWFYPEELNARRTA